jgi:ABC-2 type transport system permease protein
VRLQGQGVWHGGLASIARVRLTSPVGVVVNFITKTLVIAEVEIRKLRHDPTEVFTRVVQPVLWLLVFGQVFARTRAIPTGTMPYIDFMTPGILAQSILFTSIFYGIAIIWERDLGIIYKFLVSPTPRTAIVLGKGLSAGVRGTVQAVILYFLAALLGVQINWNPVALFGVFIAVLLGSALFATFSLIIACLVKTRERFMGIGQVLTMPLFFASNAIYPIAMMPHWLQVIALLNPLTYLVDALRTMMVIGGQGAHFLGLDFAVLLAVTAVLVVIGGRLYQNVGN